MTSGAIFLSASVPDPRCAPEFAATADSVAIAAAVSALAYVTLGRRRLVWGGNPAITPMIWAVATDVGVQYESWVSLYQSRFFVDEFPEDNGRFGNVQYVDAESGGREDSLLAMRYRMLSDQAFSAAVFIGGMGGIIQEFDLFREMHPEAQVLPILSTGGAVLALASKLDEPVRDLVENLDYVSLFHKRLGISVREERFRTPSEQPEEVEKRLWRG